MSEKRKDGKGRILLPGERQRGDGMYEFRYTDQFGNKKSIYSWKLVSTDKVEAGKRCKTPLRELERQIRRDMEDEIDTATAYSKTLNFFFDQYIGMKHELKQSTRTNYKYMYDKYVREKLGVMQMASIKYSDIKKFYLTLIEDVGFKPRSMEIVHTILHPVFEMCVRDCKIRTNPTDGVMSDIKRGRDWTYEKRHALTVQQQEAFVTYCRESDQYRHWLPLFTVMLGTGCRVGEIIGLRWVDCDFERGAISVNHNLVYRVQDNGKCEFHITTTKTRSGVRLVPMLNAVREALVGEWNRQTVEGFNETEIDGYSGFIFSNRFGDVLSPHSINRAIARIAEAYNAKESASAAAEGREANLLPHFSAHHLRHTFCTRFCENETNIKVIQEIMGHANITTTMDVYNEATMDSKIKSFASLEGKICLT